MTKVAFFGASVTAQKEGYVTVFQNLTKDKDITVFRNSYGGMSLDDAGICFIDEVLKDSPNYIFLDWVSASVSQEGVLLKKFLDCIIRKCLLQNSIPVFLIIGTLPMPKKRNMMIEETIKYAEEFNLYFINLFDKVNLKELIKDSVHTNSKGSEYYGKRVYEEFCGILKQGLRNYEISEKNIYCDILYKDLDYSVESYISIEGNFQLIGIYQDIGPFSGLIEKHVDSKIDKESIWDIYCHYTRKILKINTTSECKNVKVNILQENFDTSTCRREYDFTDKKRYLRIYKLFYIGYISAMEIDGNNIPI